MTRSDFQALSAARMREAKTLAGAGMHDGAYYLGGLTVECALKACIARATQRFEFPDKERAQSAYSHNLESLLRLSGLDGRLRAAGSGVNAAWTRVKAWKVESRYQMGKSAVEVTDFLQAASGRAGVLPWLRRFW
jgi:hypothetical protein